MTSSDVTPSKPFLAATFSQHEDHLRTMPSDTSLAAYRGDQAYRELGSLNSTPSKRLDERVLNSLPNDAPSGRFPSGMKEGCHLYLFIQTMRWSRIAILHDGSRHVVLGMLLSPPCHITSSDSQAKNLSPSSSSCRVTLLLITLERRSGRLKPQPWPQRPWSSTCCDAALSS
ncbi:hypothetical protein HDV57DRAFT_332331 [Trichoderma longibrachiatum]